MRPRLVALVPFAPALAVGFVLAWWAYSGGGYSAYFGVTRAFPGALFLVLLTGTVVVARTDLVRSLSVRTRVAAGLLFAYAAWCALSISWAVDKGNAWDGANRELLYATIFLLVSLVPWTPRAALVALSGLVGVTALIAAATLDGAARAADPSTYFIAGRLSLPIGYPNATAELLLAPFWVGVGLAAQRQRAFALRASMLACAGALLAVALMCQSRGAAYTFPVVAVVFIAVTRDRLRSLLSLAVVCGIVALNARPLLHVYTVLHRSSSHAALRDAQHALVLVFVELLAIGALWALVDLRLRVPASVTRWLGRILLVVGVAGVLAGATAAIVLPTPHAKIQRAWHQFKHNDRPTNDSGRFNAGLGSNRYDFWRVAVWELRRNPVKGVGIDNFAIDYVARRKSIEEPLYPHSFEMRTLAQTGLVGALLLLGFLLVATAAGLRGRAMPDRLGARLAPLALMPFADWLVHGSADWFWEFPVLGGVALSGLAIAGALGAAGERDVREARPRQHRFGTLTVALAAGGLLAICASIAFPLAAERNVEAAATGWRADPARARTELDRARRLNPLSIQPDVYAAEIALHRRDWPWMELSLREAVARDPGDWYSHFALGLAEDALQRKRLAIAELRVARTLNPGEPLVREALAEIQSGHRVSPRRYDALLAERNNALAR